METRNQQELLRLTNINLAYGQVQALKQAYLGLRRSEIHAVVGEHGAGKSSLGLMLNGILQPVSGSIIFEGKSYPSLTVSLALKLGIRMSYQQVRLYEEFTVAENLFLTNNAINRLAWNPKKRFLKAARELLERHNVDIDPAIPIKHLNLSDQTLVELLKHLYQRPKLLILDEVIERLSSPARHNVLNIFQQLRRDGMSLLVITHRIDDVYTFADTVSVLKNGEILFTDDVRHVDKLNLITMAYTQISAEPKLDNLNQEFSQLFKYNEAILRHLPVNVIVTDPEQRIKMVNDYCKQTFGLENPSYLNVPLTELLSHNSDEVLERLNTAIVSREERVLYQIPLRLKMITIISNLKTFPIYDGATPIGNILIIEDITEYDRLQKQMILSEKLASVGLLAAGVAHEINNPLEIIYNSLSYMKYNYNADGLHQEIDDVHEQVSSIAAIVSNLHAFSDKRKAVHEVIDVNELIQNMLNLVKYSAKANQITIHFEPTDTDLYITASRNEIKQVLLNLLKNSFEAMPAGGEIFIRSSQITKGEAVFARIIFTDTGTGICDENPDNIFLPFYSTKKGSEQNLGLGLSVSYGIIQKYHGTISVQNIEHAGCQFVISIPSAPSV